MSYYRPPESDLGDVSGHYALLVGRWNTEIVEKLKAGAIKALQKEGITEDSISTFYVPGAFEMPLAAKRLAASGKYVAVITVGAVIRGGTPHFEFVAGECSNGLARVAFEQEIPVGFGVLTVDDMQQAIDRCGDNEENKGVEAATAAMEMVALLKQI